MTAGRFIVGLAVGSASCIVPLYIGELSPAGLRGRLVTVNCVAVTLGQVIAYGTSYSPSSMIEADEFSNWSDARACPKWMEMDGRTRSFTRSIAIISFAPAS